jgi:hypothetical protein
MVDKPSNELPSSPDRPGQGLPGFGGPEASHPIFTWSWYALPDGNGFLVLPSHVPMPVDPIEPPFQKVDPPTAENLPA